MRLGRAGSLVFVALAALGLAATAAAQSRQQPARRPAPPPRVETGLRMRVFGDAGLRMFAASDTFKAVLGSSSGLVFGGGVEALWGRGLSVSVDVSRFQKSGQRVFVSNGEVFPLGIDTTVGITPVAVSAGYRFVRPRQALTPFASGGINWHRYSESSRFSAAGEDVAATFTGFHVGGGAEWRASRLVSVAGVGRWLTVRNALGQAPTSAARAFGEHDLGGFDARVRVIIGR